ncbi:MAG: hypothetical protein F6K10_05460, partial [Moorea sp. SIO2B7]|nr:hypothetical protein [Moorena sp. SIO2B7]
GIICLTILSLIYTGNWITNQAHKPVEPYKQVGKGVESQWDSNSNNLIVFYPGFIQGAVNYYKKSPSEAQIEVWDTNNIEQFEKEINDKITPTDLEQKNFNLFLIVLNENLEGYNNLSSNLLSVLESKISKSLKIHLFLINGHDLYFTKKFDSSDKFLEVSESKFGKPSSYQNFGSYIISKYELH